MRKSFVSLSLSLISLVSIWSLGSGTSIVKVLFVSLLFTQVESNGTVLSTNWKEVGAKKVEGSPPDGMEMKKWEY